MSFEGLNSAPRPQRRRALLRAAARGTCTAMPASTSSSSDGQRLGRPDLGRPHAGHRSCQAGAAGSVGCAQTREQLERSACPTARRQAVSLSTPKPDDTTLRVHPMGTLSVKENVVPLDLTITSTATPHRPTATIFAISDVQINNQEEANTTVPGLLRHGAVPRLSAMRTN